ncbi:large subunit ribosomal protein L47, partial [Geosmithia morbida]
MASPVAMRPLCGRIVTSSSTSMSVRRTGGAAAVAYFSTTSPLCKRKRKVKPPNRDMNPNRGVSSIYRSGVREHISMSGMPLPRPRDFKPQIKVDEGHGLWGFFPKPGELLYTPEEAEKHGRAWSVEELRKKSWEDLHALWWTCCRERNMISTSLAELERSELGFGKREFEVRDDEDAIDVARNDPEINFEGGEGETYIPSAYEDEIEAIESSDEAASQKEVSEAGNAKPEKQI